MNNDVSERQQTRALEHDNTVGDQDNTQAIIPWPAQQQSPQTQENVNKKEQKNHRSEDEIAEEEKYKVKGRYSTIKQNRARSTKYNK